MLVSESEADLARHWLTSDRITLVENGVDLSSMPITPEAHDDFERSHELPTVTTMGRIMYQKAPWRFAELARRLESRAKFVWIGDGPVENRRKWLDGAPVTVTGWMPRDDVVSYLRSSSVFVLPSLWEGMPLALIEAQCLGIPAVASDVVGNKDVILENRSGLLARNESELFEKVEILLGDAQLRRSMRHVALSQRSRFDHARLGRETLTIYQDLLARR